MYEIWRKICQRRDANKFQSTNVNLKVFQRKLEQGEGSDFIFNVYNLSAQPPSDRKSDGSSLPGKEVSRRSSIKGLKVFARLYINDTKVAETKAQPVKWPIFEVDLGEMF